MARGLGGLVALLPCRMISRKQSYREQCPFLSHPSDFIATTVALCKAKNKTGKTKETESWWNYDNVSSSLFIVLSAPPTTFDCDTTRYSWEILNEDHARNSFTMLNSSVVVLHCSAYIFFVEVREGTAWGSRTHEKEPEANWALGCITWSWESTMHIRNVLYLQ